MSAFGDRGIRLFTFVVVLAGVYVSVVSVLRFCYFLGGFAAPSDDDSPSDYRIYYRITLNWTLASCYLYLPPLLGCIIKKTGNFCGLPECYFKFIKIVLLSFILNGIIALWQAVPELCLWNLSISNADNIHFCLHCSMWIMSLMIMLAIDITEITGLKSIFYYHLTNGNCCSLKSRQFDRFLTNMGYPGSSCLIIVLWAQKVMSFDRFLLAVIWTLGILSCNQTDDEDIKYVSRQIEKKKIWMYYSESITISPLK